MISKGGGGGGNMNFYVKYRDHFCQPYLDQPSNTDDCSNKTEVEYVFWTGSVPLDMDRKKKNGCLPYIKVDTDYKQQKSDFFCPCAR